MPGVGEQTLKVVFIGNDQNAASLLAQSLQHIKNVTLITSINQRFVRSADIAIVDCRKDSSAPVSEVSPKRFPEIPMLALIRDIFPGREKAFASAYRDYLLWPLVDSEVQYRVRSCIALFGISPSHRKTLGDVLVQRARNLLLEDLSSKLNLAHIVSKLGTNRNTLTSEFRAKYDFGPMAWLRIERMKHAAHLLKRTNQSVASIAASVGYDDSNNFSTAFRRRFGLSPLQFRKKCRTQRNQ